jgi:hypothetical protein
MGLEPTIIQKEYNMSSINRKVNRAKSKIMGNEAFDAIVNRGIQIARKQGLDAHLGDINDKGFEILAETSEISTKAREIVGKHIADTMSGKLTGA